MAQLTDDQLKFLRSMDVPLSKVFDASGMATHAYMQQMSDLGLWVAHGVTPCKKAGHTLRTRKGHCVQCRTAQLTYLRRHEVTGSVYVAHSGKQGLVKVGMTERDPADRLLALNSYSYGGCNDWKIVFQVRCNSAGRVEFSTHQKLAAYSFDAEYFNSGAKVVCRELFRCEPHIAIAAVHQCLGCLEKSEARSADTGAKKSPSCVPCHRSAMTPKQQSSLNNLHRNLTQEVLQKAFKKSFSQAVEAAQRRLQITAERRAGQSIPEHIANSPELKTMWLSGRKIPHWKDAPDLYLHLTPEMKQALEIQSSAVEKEFGLFMSTPRSKAIRATPGALRQTLNQILEEAQNKSPQVSSEQPIHKHATAQPNQPRRKLGYQCPFCRSEISTKPPTVCPKCATGIPADSGKPSLIWPEHSNHAPDTRDGTEGRHIADSK